jgi:hypothetical protein
MRTKDIILGTVTIGGIAVILFYVIMSVYHHEYVGSATPAVSRLAA